MVRKKKKNMLMLQNNRGKIVENKAIKQWSSKRINTFLLLILTYKENLIWNYFL